MIEKLSFQSGFETIVEEACLMLGRSLFWIAAPLVYKKNISQLTFFWQEVQDP